jgi:hypothetical protein
VTEEVLTKLTEEHRSKLLTGRNWSMEGPFRTCD